MVPSSFERIHMRYGIPIANAVPIIPSNFNLLRPRVMIVKSQTNRNGAEVRRVEGIDFLSDDSSSNVSAIESRTNVRSNYKPRQAKWSPSLPLGSGHSYHSKKVYRFLSIGTVPTLIALTSRYLLRYILRYSRMYLHLDLIRHLILKMTCVFNSLSSDYKSSTFHPDSTVIVLHLLIPMRNTLYLFTRYKTYPMFEPGVYCASAKSA
ncbi:uncharacterized protein GGS22DRAFT_60644 [Annulohypoxylon maeteangense]|uniref:uncharacterized protein n=1 Tax=Annulohypoxylon maeteangense TaxID=1927788 RepID=UPI0020074684|nr:uncharacterized protein GGS22DRAFT_60644 [Annulohypoxylon maeteangense]KAI0888563.1 hypothetical protein GGS22DRAFT_60644 [Annulohypoxylon maeteangense]